MRVQDSSVSLNGNVKSLEFRSQKRSLTFIRENNSTKDPFGVTPLRSELDPLKGESVEDVKDLIVKKLIELLTGRKIKTLSLQDITSTDLPPVEEPKFGAVYREDSVEVSANKLDFYAYGEVRTEDGRRIRFKVSLSLNNLEVRTSSKTVRSGSLALVDPLIVDLEGSPEFLSPAKFEFDLDGDGASENIPMLGKGKGFIFFDTNDNGKPDGGEIVGTKTGDAFSELRRLDLDRNSWLDEGDESFKKLRVWLKSPSEDKVLTMSQAGIGALYTGSFRTLFDLEGSGILRNLGLYLTESGGSGILAKVDFKV